MGVVSYLTIDGEIVSETRDGVERDYLPDSLGSTIGLLDSTQTLTDTWTYWPYGEVASRNGTNPTPMQFVGTLGYHSDSPSRTHIRMRIELPGLARWQTVDALWPGQSPYKYADCQPTLLTDRFGYFPTLGCIACGQQIAQDWWSKKAHMMDHQYTHCMACCTLSSLAGDQCALDMQFLQNYYDAFLPPFRQGKKGIGRYDACLEGMGVAGGPMPGPVTPYWNCHLGCSALHPLPRGVSPLPRLANCDPLVVPGCQHG